MPWSPFQHVFWWYWLFFFLFFQWFLLKLICRIFAMFCSPRIYRLSSCLLNKLLLGVAYGDSAFLFPGAHREKYLACNTSCFQLHFLQSDHISFHRQRHTVRTCFLNRCCETWGRTTSVLTRELYFLRDNCRGNFLCSQECKYGSQGVENVFS